MDKYSTYKDSGFIWMGKIPSHWSLLKSKFLWRESFNTSATGTEDLLSVSQYDGVTPANGSRSESLIGYKVVEENNLVINIMLAWMGGFGVSAYNGLVSPAYCVYKLQGDNNPKYMHYLYKTPMCLAEFARHSTGVIPSRWRMYTNDFGQILTLIPPRMEQDAIVAYLDAATAKIDEAIAQQQRMIDLLNERKRIILANAVARGISEVESVKDSGVSYLGFIPNNWSVIALNYLGSYSKKTVDPSELPNTELLEYSMPAFDNGRVPHTVNSKDLDSAKTRLSESTLLINKLNVHKERIWFVENPSENSVASTEFIPIRIHSANPKFIEYALQNHRITSYLIANSNGATNSQKRVSPNTILGLKLAMPSIDEQERIVKYLDGVYEPFKKAVDACQSVVASLQERKQIIINDVVTGKVKVF